MIEEIHKLDEEHKETDTAAKAIKEADQDASLSNIADESDSEDENNQLETLSKRGDPPFKIQKDHPVSKMIGSLEER